MVGQQTAADRQVTTGVSDTLEQERYAALDVQSIQTGFAVPGVDANERQVTLVLSRPAGTTYPALADDLATDIQQHLGQPVSVSVT